jgi:Ca-activated chloride channel homolog
MALSCVHRFAYAAVLIGFLASAQEPPAPQPSAPASAQEPAQFRTSATEVMVPVTVTTTKGQFVTDLDKNDFQVFDNDQPQSITYFSRQQNQPVVVGFLMDLSNSTRTQWKDIQSAAVDLVDTLLPGGKKYAGFLVGYSTEADLLVDTVNDPEAIVAALRKARPGGGAALYDAIWKACTERTLIPGEPYEPRRVLVIVGDGHDNASKKTLNEALELAQRDLFTIYAVNTSSYGFGSDADDDALWKLALATGGKVEYPLQNVYRDISGYLEVPTDGGNFQYDLGTGGYAAAKANSIFRAIANISNEVTTQYILRYAPDIPPNSKNHREITVKVNLPGLKVRARQVYYPFEAAAVPPRSR